MRKRMVEYIDNLQNDHRRAAAALEEQVHLGKTNGNDNTEIKEQAQEATPVFLFRLFPFITNTTNGAAVCIVKTACRQKKRKRKAQCVRQKKRSEYSKYYDWVNAFSPWQYVRLLKNCIYADNIEISNRCNVWISPIISVTGIDIACVAVAGCTSTIHRSFSNRQSPKFHRTWRLRFASRSATTNIFRTYVKSRYYR